MAESKGKFITMLCSLLEFKSDAKAEVFQKVKSLTGREWDQLEPEGWYDTKVYGAIFEIMEKHYGTAVALASIKIMGRRLYPTIEKTVGLPKHLKTPLDWLKWENNSFLNDTRGPGVIPRKFIKTEPGHVIVEAVSPGYSCVLVEGLYESILNLCGITDYKVTQTRCVERGDPVCEYDIRWKEA